MQALQNLAHRVSGAYRRGLGTRGGAPRRVHRRLPHARWRTPPGAAGAGAAGLQPVMRGVPAGRTRRPAAGAGKMAARHPGRRVCRRGTLRRRAAGRHPHRRLAGADRLYPRLYRGKQVAIRFFRKFWKTSVIALYKRLWENYPILR